MYSKVLSEKKELAVFSSIANTQKHLPCTFPPFFPKFQDSLHNSPHNSPQQNSLHNSPQNSLQKSMQDSVQDSVQGSVQDRDVSDMVLRKRYVTLCQMKRSMEQDVLSFDHWQQSTAQLLTDANADADHADTAGYGSNTAGKWS